MHVSFNRQKILLLPTVVYESIAESLELIQNPVQSIHGLQNSLMTAYPLDKQLFNLAYKVPC